MSRIKESQNRALVLEAFDTLFNKRDYVAAERYWSPNYIQHSAHIEPGRDGLFSLIKNVPATLKYEPGVIVADGDFVIVHGRFSGHGRPKSWIAADILRIVDGVLVEHWDVLQDEASQAESRVVYLCSETVSPSDAGTNPSPIFTSRFAESCEAGSATTRAYAPRSSIAHRSNPDSGGT